MAPLREALSVRQLRSDADSKSSVWGGEIDATWAVLTTPNGGYIFGLIIEAAIEHQKEHSPSLREPFHATAHFLRPNKAFLTQSTGESGQSSKIPAPFEVKVKTVKESKSSANVIAEMFQGDQLTVSTHIMFSPETSVESFSGTARTRANLDSSNTVLPTLVPPSPYARCIPLRTHPSDSPNTPLHDVWRFKKHISAREDPVYGPLNQAENRASVTEPSSAVIREPPGLEFGAWLTLNDEDGHMRPTMLTFCADVVKPLPELLPPEENPTQGKTWYATLTMTIEFKAPLSLLKDDAYSSNTVGIYTLGRFIQEPNGRHDTYVEIWTSPSEKPNTVQDKSDWRVRQRCLAVTHQTAVCIPYEATVKKSRV